MPTLIIQGRSVVITDADGQSVEMSILHLQELVNTADFRYAVEDIEREMLASFQFQEVV